MTRLFLTACVFVELVVLGALGCVFTLGGLPRSPATLVYAAGVVLAFAAATAFALPRAWVERASLHGALVAGSVLFALPFVWLVGTSFKYTEEMFVTPPKWVPAAAHPVRVSPYVVTPRGADAAEDQPTLWARCVEMIPPGELARVDGDAARRAMLTLLRDADERHLTPEAVAAAWSGVYRGVELGSMTVTDVDGREFAVPPEGVRWSASSGAAIDEALRVSYDLTNTDQFTLTATLDRAWLDEHVGPGRLLAVSVPIRQDRTWHRFIAELRIDGSSHATRDALHLGDFRWRRLTFKLHERDPVDERQLGVFPLHRAADINDGDGVALDVTVTRNGPLAATWAKYTQNYREAWYADRHWPRFVWNSTLLVALNVAGQLLACSMAAFAFARLRWPGRDLLFFVLLATMMLPAFATMIPRFLIFKQLGWYNTLLPLWVPAFTGTPFFIFLLRQFMMGVPRELEESARIDGASWLGIYWRIILPLMKPALAAVAVFTFMDTWNEFMAPLVYLSDERLYPLSLGLFNFRSQFSGEFGLLMAASTMMTLPVVALFFLCQRYFIQGVTLTGLKG